MTAPPPLSTLELATGMVLGVRDGDPLPAPEGFTAAQALERAMLPALRRAPCLVSFSGGRDSAAVLATATAVARREGLVDPIPATNVFPHAPGADETDWQERVVRHLGLREWLRIEHGDELDLIGPYAQRVLRRHGVLWPFNLHFHLPLLDAAAGGSLLTGVGGDELFGAATRDRVAALLRGHERPRPRDLLGVGLALAPRPIRRCVIARRRRLTLPWLRPAARAAASAALADWSVSQPRGLAARLGFTLRARYIASGTAGMSLLAADHDVLLAHPLLSPELWAAVARDAAPLGFAGRTEGMRRLFGEVLPEEVCNRASKANFNEAFWTERTRAFVRRWDGRGVPEQWVEPAALAEHWSRERPAANSFSLLQSVWLASADRLEQPLDRIPA